MFWLVETPSQFGELVYKGFKQVYVEVISSLEEINCIFIATPQEQFILSINHSEALSLEKEHVLEWLKGMEKIQVKNKVDTLKYLPFKNLEDISIQENIYIPLPSIYESIKSRTHNVNYIVPISKLFEICNMGYEKVKQLQYKPYYDFYNTKGSIVYSALSQNGIPIDTQIFEDLYDYSPPSSQIYPEYNFKTATRRPSCLYNNINFLALNKKDGSRKLIKPKNDCIIEIDISSYHPTILANLLGYDFGEENIHQHFSNLYGVDYQKAKEITFKQLNGGIFENYKNIEFFKKTQNFIDELYNQYNTHGYIESPISKWRFEKQILGDIKPQKLFNYLLQEIETSQNINIMWEIFKTLRGKSSYLFLYVYDAFVFDWNNQDDFEQITLIFDKYLLKTKISKGEDYNL